MTINKFYKRLAWLKKRGFGNRSVVINKRTFSHPLERDGCCMLPVVDFKMDSYNILDDDGGMIENKDGSERLGVSLILLGEKIPKEKRARTESPELHTTNASPDISQRYNELIMEVARKWPNESRHETARRYIREAENSSMSGSDVAKQSGIA